MKTALLGFDEITKKVVYLNIWECDGITIGETLDLLKETERIIDERIKDIIEG